jgi:hypothetical protein
MECGAVYSEDKYISYRGSSTSMHETAEYPENVHNST